LLTESKPDFKPRLCKIARNLSHKSLGKPENRKLKQNLYKQTEPSYKIGNFSARVGSLKENLLKEEVPMLETENVRSSANPMTTVD
jgi:hypothetical protein